jgi:hypothetical protein
VQLDAETFDVGQRHGDRSVAEHSSDQAPVLPRSVKKTYPAPPLAN